ncbi:MAG: lipid-A-disaccharide synthase [Lentisphaeria bacterium]
MNGSIWILAGETSGDAYGARLAGELQRQAPAVRLRGMGGAAMGAAGVELLVDSSRLGVIGLVEVLRHLRTFLRIFKDLVARAAAERPAAVVLIDYPGFNLRFARRMKALGIPVVYYVSPQVWAWGRGRIPEIARVVRRMLVLFPFEVEVYRGTGLDVRFVGHPLIEIMDARREPGLAREPDTVLLLPGSRHGEIARLFSPMLETVRWLRARRPELRFVLAAPNAEIAARCHARLAAAGETAVRVEVGRTQHWMQRAGTGLAASGTVTVEAAILGLPLVVIYRLNPLTYWLGRWLVKIPYFTMVNLVAGKRVFAEFLQQEVRAERLGPALLELLPGGGRRGEVEAGMAEAVTALGGGGNASAEAARLILEVAGGG